MNTFFYCLSCGKKDTDIEFVFGYQCCVNCNKEDDDTLFKLCGEKRAYRKKSSCDPYIPSKAVYKQSRKHLLGWLELWHYSLQNKELENAQIGLRRYTLKEAIKVYQRRLYNLRQTYYKQYFGIYY